MDNINELSEINLHDIAYIKFALDKDDDILRQSAAMDGLPYMPLLPSYEAFVLQQMSYEMFLTAYNTAVRIAIAEGSNYADVKFG